MTQWPALTPGEKPKPANIAVMKRASTQQRIGPRTLFRSLAWLRICAIAGQSTAVLVCALWMQMDIPLLPLMVGIGLLAVFAMFAAWRLTQPWPIRQWETIVHVALGHPGAGLPAAFHRRCEQPVHHPLLLIPIALSAAALTVNAVLVVAALVGAAYAVLLFWYVPLPVPMHSTSGFSLHVLGMGVNFVIMAVLLGFFINRLARAARLQQLEMQRVRERALRDEGILAIATQAAGAAHELNTPLSTMRTLLPELRREHAGDTALAEDLELLEGQVDRCRTILREMVAFGKAQLSQEPEQLTVDKFIHGCLERFQLLRPEADLALALDQEAARTVLRTPPGLRHALLNLLNNAADASAINQSQAVALTVRRDDGWLELIVADHGPGFADPTGELSELGRSHKQSGLGIGLALAEATAERLAGELIALNTGHGAQMRLRLPLAVIAAP